MNTLEEQLRRAMKDVRLSDTERASLRGKLLSEMAQTSLSVTSRRLYSRALTRNRLKKTMPIALLIALLMSGSVSYAAEGSLPGDALYPVKIHINENVRGALAVSDIAKANLEVDLADRRLTEAEQLDHEQRLDKATSLELSAGFTRHRIFAGERIKEVEKSDKKEADQISGELDLRINGHHDVLRLLGIDENDGQDDEESISLEDGRPSESGASTTSGGVKTKNDNENGGTRNDSKKTAPAIKLNVEVSPELNLAPKDDQKDTSSENSDDNERGLQLPIVIPPVFSVPTTSPAPSVPVSVKSFTLAEIALHNTETNCYSAISGSVYDLTSFIGSHPGGSVILSICGKDGTALFMAQHGGAGKPESVLITLKIGTLVL